MPLSLRPLSLKPLSLKPLAEQVIVVTGASSGIGLATALAAAKAGARVVLVSRGEAALKEAVRRIEADGGEAACAVADVGDRGAVEAAARLAIDRFGRIDTWVNNAGVAIYSDLLATPRNEHERLFRTNYWGAVNGAEAAVACMRASGGALITVGSVASDMGSPVMGAYVAAKHAVKGYIDSLRIELNRDKVPISVTLIKPSGIGTPLDEHVANHRPGEVKLPPPVYAPELVADAILRAAVRPLREETVGGAGAAQVMFATHFPGLFARIAGAMTAVLNDPSKPGAQEGILFHPGSGGETRYRGPRPRRFSLYTTAHRHPLAVAGLGAVAGLALAGVLGRRR